jgi:hypothetical protein
MHRRSFVSRRIGGETGQHPPCLCKQIGNLEQLLNDARAVMIALGFNVRSGSVTDRHRNGVAKGWDVKLPKRPKEFLNFIGERSGLLHSREMTALFHHRPALNVSVGLFCD